MTATLPWSYYSDHAVLDRERRFLFAHSWHYVGNIHDLPRAGSSYPVDVAGLPIVVTRDRSDELRALINVCAHRGTVVCSAPEERDTLVCPYHAWRYELDGRLKSAPRSDREPGFDASIHGLEQVGLGRWGPFLFVSASSASMPFDEWIADVPEKVAACGIDVDDLVFRTRWTTTLETNWKVSVENFLECYHCRIAHPGFSKAIATGPDEYVLETAPTYSTQYGPVRENWSGEFDPRGPISRGQFHLLYPNTVINIMPGHPNMSIGPVTPTTPTRTHRMLDYFFGSGLDEGWIEDMMKFDAQVGAEDTILVETMQRGLNARPDGIGTLFVDSEELIAHFDDYVRSRID